MRLLPSSGVVRAPVVDRRAGKVGEANLGEAGGTGWAAFGAHERVELRGPKDSDRFRVRQVEL
jgi:hypothetical protein